MLTNAEYWPQELWNVLTELWEQSRQDNRSRTPQVRITNVKCPEYASPTGDIREEFNTGVRTLVDAGLIRAEWQRNASSFVTKIRLQNDQLETLEKLLDEFGHLPRSKDQTNVEETRRLVQVAFERYGILGLKTLSQIAFGDSKQLTANTLIASDISPDTYWVQPDAVTIGASVVRVGGLVQLSGSTASYLPRWELPGHYLWDWEIANLTVETIGNCLYLIENPYPMWELMRRFANLPIAFACVHGETQFELGDESALAICLKKIYAHSPGLETFIWCDPDPAGLNIANNAYALVEALGGKPRFWLMNGDVLGYIESMVIAEQRLKTLDEPRRHMLEKLKLNQELESLRQVILTKGAYGEQEALVCGVTQKNDVLLFGAKK